MFSPRPANESARLEALRRFRILDTPAEPAFDDFAKVAAVVCGTPIAIMSLIDAERQWFKARVGLETSETSRELAFCAHTIMGSEPFIVEDASADPRFSGNPLVTAEPNIRFYTGAPLIDSEGHALGSLCVIDRRPRRLTPEQTGALQALSRRIISELEFRRAAWQLASALEEVETLQGLLPICSHCKSVREEGSYWQSVEKYMLAHSSLEFTHSICPKCLELMHPALYARMVEKERLKKEALEAKSGSAG